jgi:hypothetical protein
MSIRPDHPPGKILEHFDRPSLGTQIFRHGGLRMRVRAGKNMKLQMLLSAVLLVSWPVFCNAAERSNLNDVPTDLKVPKVTDGSPRAGTRVWQTNPGYEGWNVAHALYLPTEWNQNGRYPVLFEFAGNGDYQNELGDRCDGTVESCEMGYGLSGGKGMIWVSLPFVDRQTRAHARVWWGDPDETVKYCKQTVARICRDYGGDSKRLILLGFSRGAIACNYIGLRDDEIAGLWRGFMAHSHYDGVRPWNYADSDSVSAEKRLARLGRRPQFVSHEESTQATEEYLRRTHPQGVFTFAALTYRNHSSSWVLKDVPNRNQARQWLAKLLRN